MAQMLSDKGRGGDCRIEGNVDRGSMTKAVLVEEVAQVTDLTKKHAEVIVETVFPQHHRRAASRREGRVARFR